MLIADPNKINWKKLPLGDDTELIATQINNKTGDSSKFTESILRVQVGQIAERTAEYFINIIREKTLNKRNVSELDLFLLNCLKQLFPPFALKIHRDQVFIGGCSDPRRRRHMTAAVLRSQILGEDAREKR